MTVTSGVPTYSCCFHRTSARTRSVACLRCFQLKPSDNGSNEEAFWSLLRLRGIECNAPSRLAEAFFVRKMSARGEYLEGASPRRLPGCREPVMGPAPHPKRSTTDYRAMRAFCPLCTPLAGKLRWHP